jgi:predicted MPP superfamily phosphohydrolase
MKPFKLRLRYLAVIFGVIILILFFFFWFFLKPSPPINTRNLAAFLAWQEAASNQKDLVDSSVAEILRFAVMGDFHIGAFYKNEVYLKEALKKAAEREVDFVVILGDLTQNGSFEEYQILKDILESSGIKYFVVPGNHDVGEEAQKEGLNNYRHFFGNDTYREVVIDKIPGKEIKKVSLFFIDTALWREGNKTLLGAEQWLWLKNRMKDVTYDPQALRLFFSHYSFDKLPLTDSSYLRQYICESFADGWFEADLHRTERFLRECPVPLHNDQMEKVALKFPTFKVGSFFKPDREFPGFLIIHYFDNRFFEMERIIVGSEGWQINESK